MGRRPRRPLERLLALTGDPALPALHDEVHGYPNVVAALAPTEQALRAAALGVS